MSYSAEASDPYENRPAFNLHLYVRRNDTDAANNRATYAWELRARNPQRSKLTYELDARSWSANVGGYVWGGASALDFRPGQEYIVLGSGVTPWITHDSDGHKTIAFSAGHNAQWFGYAGLSGQLVADRIATEPPAPHAIDFVPQSATSIRYRFGSNGDGGTPVIEWQAQIATNAEFTQGVQTIPSGGTTTFTSLTTTKKYWARARGRNAVGWGAWSPALSATIQLPAPTLGTLARSASGALTVPWTAPAETAQLNGYRVEIASDPTFATDLVRVDLGNVRTYTHAVTPGRTYYARVTARTAGGINTWSETKSFLLQLPAPNFQSWAQNASGGMVADWLPPAATNGLIGYRIMVARDASFTQGVRTYTVGDVLTHTITGLTPGRTYWAKVSSRTSIGDHLYSNFRSRALSLSSGDLDGWTRFGTKPAAVEYYTTAGLRRGTIGTAQALYVENLSTGAVTLAADTYGIQRTITGLTAGKAYRFTVRGTLISGANASSYRLFAPGVTGAATTITTGGVTFTAIDFVASGSSAIIGIRLATETSVPDAVDRLESIAFSAIQVLQLATDYPQRLRETVYESNLANHFDLACNSVGALWYVDKAGDTRFKLPGAALPVTARFSDDADESAAHYIDITAGYDTRGMINRIEATNYGVDATRTKEQNEMLIVQDEISLAEFGARTERLSVNLWTQAPYAAAFSQRLSTVLNARKEPELSISSIRWNAQENLDLAAALEVGDRVNVRYRGVGYDVQIVTIKHTITAKRWITELTFQKI